jgi:nuclear pore complex protein Nup205
MQNSKTDRRGAKRKSFGKRKHSDQEGSEELPAQQRSIADLFARSGGDRSGHNSRNQQHSPSNKRHRPESLHSSPHIQRSELFAPDKMYNFPNSDQKAGGTPVGMNQSSSDARTAALRARAYNASPRPSNFTPHTGAKKLVVKNIRAIPRLNQESYFEKVWGQLDTALSAIFNNKKPTHSLEELYKGAENVCRQGRAAPLSKKLDEKCKEYTSGVLRESILEKSDGGDNVDTLRIVIDAWSTWNSRLVHIFRLP